MELPFAHLEKKKIITWLLFVAKDHTVMVHFIQLLFAMKLWVCLDPPNDEGETYTVCDTEPSSFATKGPSC